MSKGERHIHGLVLSVLISLFFVSIMFTTTLSKESSFRREFIENYKRLRFEEQVRLVKKSKDIMPGEIRALIDEAMEEGKDFEDRMYLLDIASTMAYMYKHWHGNGEDLIKEIQTLIRTEIRKEEERIAEIMKWKKEEWFLGNFVMKTHLKEMEAEGLSPVLFPHWVHRIWFKCKVCHDEIFIMKRWTNDISQQKILQGKQCGVCHNGKMAFGADRDCERCHIAGKAEAKRLYDVTHINHERIKEVADRLGAEWHPENLPDGRLPLDRFRFINWIELKKRKVFKPVTSLNKDFKDEVRDNKILFESTSPVVNNVVFDHEIHSSWIKCSTCHPALFKDKLGGNRIRMIDMARGMFCGHCHGRVSFTFADCKRCHNQPKNVPVKGALLHSQKG